MMNSHEFDFRTSTQRTTLKIPYQKRLGKTNNKRISSHSPPILAIAHMSWNLCLYKYPQGAVSDVTALTFAGDHILYTPWEIQERMKKYANGITSRIYSTLYQYQLEIKYYNGKPNFIFREGTCNKRKMRSNQPRKLGGANHHTTSSNWSN